jgi:hypothetical protein
VVELMAGVRSTASSNGNYRGLRITKNGEADFVGASGSLSQVVLTSSSYSLTVRTPPILVVPGDYFEAEYYSANIAIATDNASPRNFFSCMVRAAQ